MRRSTRSGDIPLPSPATFGYLTVVRTQGVGNLTQKALRECRIWNVPGWGGKFEPKLSSLSSGVLSSFNFCHRGDTNLICAHTSTTHSVLEATASSWSFTVLRQGQAPGLFSLFDNFFFKRSIDHQIWRLDTAFERNFGPGGNFKERIFKSLNARDIALEGNVETLN